MGVGYFTCGSEGTGGGDIWQIAPYSNNHIWPNQSWGTLTTTGFWSDALRQTNITCVVLGTKILNLDLTVGKQSDTSKVRNILWSSWPGLLKIINIMKGQEKEKEKVREPLHIKETWQLNAAHNLWLAFGYKKGINYTNGIIEEILKCTEYW